MSVHYKFKSSLTYDTVTFDGLHISVGDLKKEIIKQKKMGKSADYDLQIIDAQTKQGYNKDSDLIPKNTSVIVARVPSSNANRKHFDKNENNSTQNDGSSKGAFEVIKQSNLSGSQVSEDEKIKAMVSQSTQDYDPSKYVKSRGYYGQPPPPNYTCHRCGQPGHYIKQCPTNNMEIKRSTGIPRSFMIPATADQKGAMLTASGDYAVPVIDYEAYQAPKKEKKPFIEDTTDTKAAAPEFEIPLDLRCPLCTNLLQDAVMTPCCGNSFCDECLYYQLSRPLLLPLLANTLVIMMISFICVSNMKTLLVGSLRMK